MASVVSDNVSVPDSLDDGKGEKEEKEEDDNEKDRDMAKGKEKKKKKKDRGLYVAPVEDYVDDGDLYQPRYDDMSRLRYWEFLLDHPKRKKVPKDFVGWTAQSQRDNFSAEILNYSACSRFILSVAATPYWDYLYLYSFGLWIVLVIAYFDELCRIYILVPKTLLYLPPLIMFISQLVPTLFSLYAITNCNDLCKLVARHTFSFWVRQTLS